MTAPTEVITPRSRTEQKTARVLPGLPLAIAAVTLIVAAGLFAVIVDTTTAYQIGGAIIVLALLAAPGFFVLQPNASMVLILFGRYIGTEDRDGLWWTNR